MPRKNAGAGIYGADYRGQPGVANVERSSARQLADVSGIGVAVLSIYPPDWHGDARRTGSGLRSVGVEAAKWFRSSATCLRAFAEADLVVCRSGAGAVSELAAAGKPSMLIPFPFAADDHQTKNAEVMEHAGAAIRSSDKEWTGAKLFESVGEL